jgi:hypothetical protein
VHDVPITARLEPTAENAHGGIPLCAFDDGLALSTRHQFRQIGVVIFPEEEALLIAEQVLLVVILEGEAGGGAGGGESELIDNLLPKFVVGYGLSSALLADGLVELIQIEFLSADLWYFDLRDALGSPVFAEVLLKFVLLF